MKALIQRVSEAKVEIKDEIAGRIGRGILVFLGVEKGDTDRDIDYIVKKITNLRIFEDTEGKMNLSIKDVKGEILVVSQFTLAANCQKGNRPSFDKAEKPEIAREIYSKLVDKLRQEGTSIATGKFAAKMKVHIINDGPVTILLFSPKKQ